MRRHRFLEVDRSHLCKLSDGGKYETGIADGLDKDSSGVLVNGFRKQLRLQVSNIFDLDIELFEQLCQLMSDSARHGDEIGSLR